MLQTAKSESLAEIQQFLIFGNISLFLSEFLLEGHGIESILG